MVDFRKLLLTLAAMALLFTSVASAVDFPYSCNATAVPTLVRSEGIAEQVGDILLTCGGTVPSAGIEANVRVKLNTEITSNLKSASDPPVSDALLVLNEDADAHQFRAEGSLTGAPKVTVFQGRWISDKEMEFLGVVLAAPGSNVGMQTLRITNLRANAQALGTDATIFGTINITGSTTVPVDNNSLVVADTRPGMKFSFSLDEGAFKNCIKPDVDSIENAMLFLEFKEGFASAFRPKLDGGSDHSIPGGGYKDESGFNPDLFAGELIGSGIGEASQGTRLMVRLSGIPSGVKLYAPAQIVTDSGLVLKLYTGTKSDAYRLGAQGDLASGGTGTKVEVSTRFAYEVTSIGASYGVTDTVVVPLLVKYDTPGPLGTVKVKGSFAPLSNIFSVSEEIDAEVSAPEPRFIDNATEADLFAISTCRTVLLFPFVSNQVGFNTGLAIANTTKDPLETTAQEGTCSWYFYGNVDGGPAPEDPVVTETVASGTVQTALLSDLLPDFQGYAIAVCDFQFAHGYAFISDENADKLAHGFIALVLPDRERLAQHASRNADANEGEQLGN